MNKASKVNSPSQRNTSKATSKVIQSKASIAAPKPAMSPKASATGTKPKPAQAASQGSALGSTAKDSLVKAHSDAAATSVENKGGTENISTSHTCTVVI